MRTKFFLTTLLAFGLSQPAIAQDAAQTATETAETATAEAAAAPVPAEENMLHLDLSTGGRVTIKLFPALAPKHVERIKTLVRRGFYDGIVFHRVIEGFMAQTGDPTGTGTSGSDLPDIKAEFNPYPHLRGTLSMARAASEDSANSQFFIVFQPRFSLDKKYTNFGRVMSGMQYVDTIVRGEPPSNPSYIVQASVAIDNKALPDFANLNRAGAPEKEISVDDLNAPIASSN